MRDFVYRPCTLRFVYTGSCDAVAGCLSPCISPDVNFISLCKLWALLLPSLYVGFLLASIPSLLFYVISVYFLCYSCILCIKFLWYLILFVPPFLSSFPVFCHVSCSLSSSHRLCLGLLFISSCILCSKFLWCFIFPVPSFVSLFLCPALCVALYLPPLSLSCVSFCIF